MRRINPEAPLTPSQKYKRYYDKHRDEVLAKNAKYHQDNKEEIAKRHRLCPYKLTQEQYDKKLQAQNNRCAICYKEFVKTPHIDHSHKTGENRGLLCDDCNLGLGRFKDSIVILNSAIQYVKEYSNGGRQSNPNSPGPPSC